MWLTDEAAVTGRSVLAGTDDPRPVPLERLFAAAEAGEPVRLDVTVRGRDGVIVGIEEVPSDTGESPGRNGGSRRGQEPGQPESEEPQAEDGPGATDEELPEPLTDIEHGGQHWAVLWVGEYGDSELDRVREAIDQRWGPVWSDGDLACDRGAAEALDADPDARRVAVYFDAEADARQFAKHAERPSEPAGYAQVTTHCLD